jgi:AraC-like DNA-binding protein
MKSAIRKLPIRSTKSYAIYDLVAPHFDPDWHFHQEYQLVVVLEGTGTRFIGDDISHFEAGDMVLTGANLPHVWKNDEAYFQNVGLKTRCVVIYFPRDFMGKSFLNMEEMKGIKDLLDKAHRGLEISGKVRDRIQKIMLQILNQKGFEGVLSLLKILNILANANDLKYINKEGYLNTIAESDSQRMKNIHAYILNNYKTNIKLENVAALANLSPTSFSRYFKAHTNKSFSDFVSELRISFACKLLHQDDASISQIAHDSGYKTLSNFNKKFKDLTGTSPLKYRKNYRNVM